MISFTDPEQQFPQKSGLTFDTMMKIKKIFGIADEEKAKEITN